MRELPRSLKEVLEQIPPKTNCMDVLRTGCSFLGNIEPEMEDVDALRTPERVIACISSIMLYWYCFQHDKQEPNLDKGNENTATHFLRILHGKNPSELHQ